MNDSYLQKDKIYTHEMWNNKIMRLDAEKEKVNQLGFR